MSIWNGVCQIHQRDVLIMQIDIEKAFDTIQWDLVEATMVKLGFGPRMSQIIN